MGKRVFKKSELLREGYVSGLKKAQQIIEAALEGHEDTEMDRVCDKAISMIKTLKNNHTKDRHEERQSSYEALLQLGDCFEAIEEIVKKRFGF